MRVKVEKGAVVRRFASARTHVLDTDDYVAWPSTTFGADYTAVSGTALCGVRLQGAVVMQSGSNIYCGACKHLARKDDR